MEGVRNLPILLYAVKNYKTNMPKDNERLPTSAYSTPLYNLTELSQVLTKSNALTPTYNWFFTHQFHHLV